MGARLIRVSSRATGTRRHVRVYVYDTVQEMRAAGEAFNGNNNDDAWGLTQAYMREGRITLTVIRLCTESLGAPVVAHECHHAAEAIYGSTLAPQARARTHLSHHNEVFAHLFSDLYGNLNLQLWRHGYYD